MKQNKKPSKSFSEFLERANARPQVSQKPAPKGPKDPKSEVESMRMIQRLAGETLTIMSHPGGFFEGVAQRVLELNRAKRWKALARKLRAENRRLRAEVGWTKLQRQQKP